MGKWWRNPVVFWVKIPLNLHINSDLLSLLQWWLAGKSPSISFHDFPMKNLPFIEDWNQLATFDYRVNHHEIWTIAIFHGKLGKLPFFNQKHTIFELRFGQRTKSSNSKGSLAMLWPSAKAIWQLMKHGKHGCVKVYRVYFLLSSLFSALSIYSVLVWFIYILST